MSNIILGGGISGLCTAFYLSKSVKDGIKVFESSQRLGGWIKTSKKNNGTLFEHGPRTLRCGGIAAENTLQLVKELGLEPLIQPVPRTSEAAKNRMIYINNQLVSLPNSWRALFKIDPPFIRPFLYAIVNDLKTPKKQVVDESIYDFVARRFGEDYAEIPLSAMICGIFAGDAKEISVKALMSSLFEKEQEYGSVIGGMIYSLKNKFANLSRAPKTLKSAESKKWSVWSLKNGLETLPNHISCYLKEKKNLPIYIGKKCTRVDFKNNEVLVTIDGKIETGKHLFSSIPCKDLAKILSDKYIFLKKELSLIPFVNVVVVNLEYEGDLLEKKGFGFLVPPNQNLPILGVIFDSCIFPQTGKTVLTVMMGGKWFDVYFKADTDENIFLKVAEDHVKSILNINEKPSSMMVQVLRDCIPQYIVGHSERVQRIRQYIEEQNLPLTLIGNSFDGVGVNDAILSAKVGVEGYLKKFKAANK